MYQQCMSWLLCVGSILLGHGCADEVSVWHVGVVAVVVFDGHGGCGGV